MLLDYLEKLALSSCEQIWDYLYSEDCGKAVYLLPKREKTEQCIAWGADKGIRCAIM